VLRPEDVEANWTSRDGVKQEALERVSFTVHEDWRSRGGWVWYGRYFRENQADAAIAFLGETIYETQSNSHSSNNDPNTEGLGERKTRLGQADFRNKVIALWGYRCALTRCRVVPALEAAHIVAWAMNKKERLSSENGLALLSTVHKLFEDGFISFTNDGRLLTRLSADDLESLGLREDMQLSKLLTQRQKIWMKEHRQRNGFSV
jgi:predicted restriction endonuclease